eukprot:jgi/Chrzof1/13966/Cz08g19200.t1
MAWLHRAARLLGAPSARQAQTVLYAQTRQLAGAAHGDPSRYVTYAGVTLEKAPTHWYVASKIFGAGTWFYVFYQLYHNWDVKVHGLPYVFEKEGLDDDEEAHAAHH